MATETQIRVHRPATTYFIPDLFVVPTAAVTPLFDRADILEVYDQPLPLVVEAWSRSTGDYDVTEKLAVCQHRSDREIWLVHPFERTLTSWRLQPDGAYESKLFRESVVRPVAFPGVSVALGQVFDSE